MESYSSSYKLPPLDTVLVHKSPLHRPKTIYLRQILYTSHCERSGFESL
jgi:hypothetical protein